MSDKKVKDAAAIREELDMLYKELSDLQAVSSQLSQSEIDLSSPKYERDTLDLDRRRANIMTLIMQRTRDYMLLNINKT